MGDGNGGAMARDRLRKNIGGAGDQVSFFGATWGGGAAGRCWKAWKAVAEDGAERSIIRVKRASSLAARARRGRCGRRAVLTGCGPRGPAAWPADPLCLACGAKRGYLGGDGWPQTMDGHVADAAFDWNHFPALSHAPLFTHNKPPLLPLLLLTDRADWGGCSRG